VTDRGRLLLFAGAGVALLAGLVIYTWGDRRAPPEPENDAGPVIVPANVPDAMDAPDAAPTPIARPAAASIAFGVFTEKSKKELAGLLDRKAVGAQLGPKHCGDPAACDAVRKLLLDEEQVRIDVAERRLWTMPTDIDKVALGLTREEKQSVEKGEWVYVIQVRGPSQQDHVHARLGFAITAFIAEKLKGIVHDQVCERMERPADFAKRAITSPLGQSAFSRNRIEFQYTPKPDGTVRLVSVGMSRFGAPDLVVESATMRVAEKLSDVLVAVAHKLERGESMSPIRVTLDDMETARGAPFGDDAGATQPPFPVMIGLEPVRAKAGDPSAFMARVVPEEGATPEGYRDLAEAFFGTLEDEEPSDEEIAQLRAKTQAKLPEVLAQYKKSKQRLLVHAPFELKGNTGSGAAEFLWMEVEGFDDKTVSGVLVDEPRYVLSKKKGDRVTRPRDQIVDFMLDTPDGAQVTPGDR
jgi:uncharacterized protein YegJ (DUF2314 family)